MREIERETEREIEREKKKDRQIEREKEYGQRCAGINLTNFICNFI